MPLFKSMMAAALFCLGVIPNVMAQSAEVECPPSQFTGWDAIGVVTPGDANRLRDEPSTQGAVIGQIPPGEAFNIIYRSSTCAAGYLWVEVQTVTQRGWTVERGIEGEPFIVPYQAPEPREIGQRLEDGSYLIDESGLRLEIPAVLNVEQAFITPHIGFFGDVMSAQPSSLILTFATTDQQSVGRLQIFPYAIREAIRDIYWGYNNSLDTLVTEQPDLLEYAADNRMPQTPIAGAAALFGGAGAYVPFNNGMGLRYLTYFAQDWVLFDEDDSLTYLYRGLTDDDAFLIAGEHGGIPIPDGTIPSGGNRSSDALYLRYIRQFEANLSALPTDAFTPDLARLDALFASLTITDNTAVMRLIP